MSENMVERLARALSLAETGDADFWRSYVDIGASVVLHAMRKPDLRMVEAGALAIQLRVPSGYGMKDMEARVYARSAYEAMIESAIRSGEKG